MQSPAAAGCSRSSSAGEYWWTEKEIMGAIIDEERTRLREVINQLGDLRARDRGSARGGGEREAMVGIMAAEDERERLSERLWIVEEDAAEQDRLMEGLVADARRKELMVNDLVHQLSKLEEIKLQLQDEQQASSMYLRKQYDRMQQDRMSGVSVAEQYGERVRSLEERFQAATKHSYEEQGEAQKRLSAIEELVRLRERDKQEVHVLLEMRKEQCERYQTLLGQKEGRMAAAVEALRAERERLSSDSVRLQTLRAELAEGVLRADRLEQECEEVLRRSIARQDFVSSLQAGGHKELQELDEEIMMTRKEADAYLQEKLDADAKNVGCQGITGRLHDRRSYIGSREKEFALLRSRLMGSNLELAKAHEEMGHSLDRVDLSHASLETAASRQWEEAVTRGVAQLEQYRDAVMRQRDMASTIERVRKDHMRDRLALGGAHLQQQHRQQQEQQQQQQQQQQCTAFSALAPLAGVGLKGPSPARSSHRPPLHSSPQLPARTPASPSSSGGASGVQSLSISTSNAFPFASVGERLSDEDQKARLSVSASSAFP